MRTMGYIIKRNIKLFFKDKGMLISSLITPIILLVLYITFLGRIYKDIFIQHFPESFKIDDKFHIEKLYFSNYHIQSMICLKPNLEKQYLFLFLLN